MPAAKKIALALGAENYNILQVRPFRFEPPKYLTVCRTMAGSPIRLSTTFISM